MTLELPVEASTTELFLIPLDQSGEPIHTLGNPQFRFGVKDLGIVELK
jgi:hypothetical protein